MLVDGLAWGLPIGELELNFDQLVACLMRALIGSVVPRNVSYVF